MAKTRVLIVDDELTALHFLKTTFELEGSLFEVKTAATVDDAIQQGRDFEPHILLTDWLLRNHKDGVDVANAILEVNPCVHVVFLTALAGELRKKLNGERLGPILEKPIDLDTVLDVVKREAGITEDPQGLT